MSGVRGPFADPLNGGPPAGQQCKQRLPTRRCPHGFIEIVIGSGPRGLVRPAALQSGAHLHHFLVAERLLRVETVLDQSGATAAVVLERPQDGERLLLARDVRGRCLAGDAAGTPRAIHVVRDLESKPEALADAARAIDVARRGARTMRA